jgi:hypothetical protein
VHTRFEARLDGYGWPAVWDNLAGCFLPGRFPDLGEARKRATMLNTGRAPVGASAASPIRKRRPAVDEPTLF